jgi:predicted ribonuclease YlaK
MKRIIRLTESDLARIVRRVIREQEETTAMAPESYWKVPAGNWDLTARVSGKDVMWTVTPKKMTTKNDKGQMVEVPGKLSLTIASKEIPNTYVTVSVDCKTKTANYSFGVVEGDYKNVSVMAAGREFKGDEAKMAFNQSFKSRAWKYAGAIKEMGDKYCSAV